MTDETQQQVAEAPKSRAPKKKNEPQDQQLAEVSAGFETVAGFEFMYRIAKALTASTLVPTAYRSHKELKEYGKVVGYEENPNAIANAMVSVNMAMRMKADPLMIMQNLYVVEGRPAWSSQFIIAALNTCGRYTPLRFEMSEQGEPREIPYKEAVWNNGKKTFVDKTVLVRDRSCYAWATEKATGQRLESPVISMDMAVAEGWLTKNGSKWQTMPEVMLRYRCASFFGKLYAPELLMGIQSQEEAIDITPEEWSVVAEPKPTLGRGATGLSDALRGTSAPPAPVEEEEMPPAKVETKAPEPEPKTASNETAKEEVEPSKAKEETQQQAPDLAAGTAPTGRKRPPIVAPE